MKTLIELFDLISLLIKNQNKLENLMCLVSQYTGDDWKDYVHFSEDKYTRNLFKKNDNIEILIICWNKYQTSGIHDHLVNGCILKVLDGEINEYIYSKDDNKKLLKIIKCKKNSIGYQQGSNGLHNIINLDKKTVSLHIYSPANYKSTFY